MVWLEISALQRVLSQPFTVKSLFGQPSLVIGFEFVESLVGFGRVGQQPAAKRFDDFVLHDAGVEDFTVFVFNFVQVVRDALGQRFGVIHKATAAFPTFKQGGNWLDFAAQLDS